MGMAGLGAVEGIVEVADAVLEDALAANLVRLGVFAIYEDKSLKLFLLPTVNEDRQHTLTLPCPKCSCGKA